VELRKYFGTIMYETMQTRIDSIINNYSSEDSTLFVTYTHLLSSLLPKMDSARVKALLTLYVLTSDTNKNRAPITLAYASQFFMPLKDLSDSIKWNLAYTRMLALVSDTGKWNGKIDSLRAKLLIGAKADTLNLFSADTSGAYLYLDSNYTYFDVASATFKLKSTKTGGTGGGGGGIAYTINGDTLNGNFETLAGANDFSYWQETVNGTSTITSDNTTKNSGTYSCKFTIDGSNSSATLLQNVSGTTGKTVHWSLYAKGSPGAVVAVVSDNNTGQDASYFVATASWANYTGSFVANDNYVEIYNGSGDSSMTINIDDVRIWITP
jgi:hypothetical protein